MDQRWPRALRALVFIAMVTGCASTRPDRDADVPVILKAPVSQVAAAQAHARGVQIYECRPSKDDPQRFEWTFRAPEADLYDHAGKRVGKHFAGPTWEANDGSKVVGEVIARDAGPDPTAIPWLLLRASSATGTGMFGQTQSIQRLHTSGGKAPADGCDQTQVGRQLREAYSADYRFFR